MGTKACGVRGETQEAHLGPSLGSSNIYEEPGPGTFSGRLHQMYSTAEAPLPLPKPLGGMGAVTTLGFLETSEMAGDEPGNGLNFYCTKVYTFSLT